MLDRLRAPIVPPRARRIGHQLERARRSLAWRARDPPAPRARPTSPPPSPATPLRRARRAGIRLRVPAIPPASTRAASTQHGGVRTVATRGDALCRVEKCRHEEVGARAPRIGLEAAHGVRRDRRVGAQQRVDAQRAPRVVAPAPPDCAPRADRSAAGWPTRDIPAPDRVPAAIAINGDVALSSRSRSTSRRAPRCPSRRRAGAESGRWSGSRCVRRDRRRACSARAPGTTRAIASSSSRRRPRVRGGVEARCSSRARLEHRPAHREPASAAPTHRSAVREVERVRRRSSSPRGPR